MKKLIIIFLLLISLQVYSYDKTFGKNPDLPTIAIITTGGTIAEVTDPKTGASVPGKPDDLIKAVPEILKIANIRLVDFSNIDSSQMTPEIWAKLSKTTDAILRDNNIRGAVITHGTDSMAQGAYFLDLTLKTKKPVVFTGAMRNSSSPFSDGPFNLFTAIRQVVAKDTQNWGVTVTLNQYINSARDVVKTNTVNPQTFNSGMKGYLGYLFASDVYRVNDTLYQEKFPIPKKFPKIYIYQDYPGGGDDVLRFMADQGADAIVIEGLGSGNVNAQVFKGIQYALNKDVLIVVTTIVPEGGAFAVYGDVGGGADLIKHGALFSRHLRSEKARILLLLAMPYVGKDKEKLKYYLSQP